MKNKLTEKQIKQILLEFRNNRELFKLNLDGLKELYNPYTLRQAGKVLGVSREMVRLYEKKYFPKEVLDKETR